MKIYNLLSTIAVGLRALAVSASDMPTTGGQKFTFETIVFTPQAIIDQITAQNLTWPFNVTAETENLLAANPWYNPVSNANPAALENFGASSATCADDCNYCMKVCWAPAWFPPAMIGHVRLLCPTPIRQVLPRCNTQR